MDMAVIHIRHVMVLVRQLFMLVRVGMFLARSTGMAMLVMIILMTVGMFMNRTFVRMVMFVIFIYQQQRADQGQGQGSQKQPGWRFLKNQEG
jgi:hypothetical protein